MKMGDKLYCYNTSYHKNYYTIGKCYKISYMNFDFLEVENDLGLYDRFSYYGDIYCFSKLFNTEKQHRLKKLEKINESR
jgi:hypothetical protein